MYEPASIRRAEERCGALEREVAAHSAMINATIGRYHIIEELGRGGMGVVYHGHDPLLNRPVAIKILSQALTGNPEAKERFLREAQGSARLNHPNIVAIYDISEHEGIYYLVFEFIKGMDLDGVLETHKGPMDINKALELFVPLAHALDYAHQHGIVHRDVKPGNVMVTEDGKVKVADFGIAWVEMSQTLTQPGQMIGSCFYFSPEQARGEKVDRRADLYSLGIVLYQMLAGRVPYLADNLPAVIQQHLTAEPKPLREFNRRIPAHIEEAVLKSMAKDPADRFQSVGEMVKALQTEGDTASADLYKTNISPSEAALHNILGNNYYKQGKLDLAIMEWRKATVLDPYNALTHNNLGTALDGLGKLPEAVEEYNKAVKLNPNNFVAHYNMGSAYYRQGQIPQSIEEYRKVTVLNPKFAPAYYNLGNGLFQQEKTDAAIDEWQKALMLNPQFAEVHYNLGNAFHSKGRKEEAMKHWEKAIELDPQFAVALYNIGSIKMEQGDVEGAMELWERSIEINPNFGQAHYNVGNWHWEQGNLDLAITEWEKAATAEHGFWQAHNNLGNAYYQRSQFDEAINQWQKTVQFEKNFWPAHWNLANTYFYHRGQLDEAIVEWQTVTQLHNNHWPSYYNLGEAYLEQGKIELAILEWDKVVQLNPGFWHVYHNLGTLFYQRGKLDQAIAYWTRAIGLMLFPWK